MNPPLRLLLLAHAGLGEGLLDAATAILGERPPVDLLTNRDRAPAEVEADIRAWLGAADGPALLLTDLSFGSLCQTARRVAGDRPDVGIVAGVNLPVLLAALRSRDLPDLASVVRHLAERGADSVETFGCGDGDEPA
jgi:mannose/fructose-specific phosphotransferase system component IIA